MHLRCTDYPKKKEGVIIWFAECDFGRRWMLKMSVWILMLWAVMKGKRGDQWTLGVFVFKNPSDHVFGYVNKYNNKVIQQ